MGVWQAIPWASAARSSIQPSRSQCIESDRPRRRGRLVASPEPGIRARLAMPFGTGALDCELFCGLAAADAPQPMWHGITPTRLAADASLVAERCFLLGAANVQRRHAEPCDPAYLCRTEAVPRPLPFPCPSSRDRDHPVPMPAQKGAQVVWPVALSVHSRPVAHRVLPTRVSSTSQTRRRI